MERILDLTTMSPEQTRRLNEIARDIRYEYADFIDDICKKYIHEDLIWSLPIVSRNTAIDGTFLKLCRVLLVIKELSDGNYQGVKGVTIDEAACISLLNPSIEIIDLIQPKSGLYHRFKAWVYNLFWRIRFDSVYIVNNYLKIQRHVTKNKHISDTVIITPLLSSTVDNGRYRDRYFTDIQKYTKDDLCFLPTIICDDGKRIKDVINQLQQDKSYSFVYYEAEGRIRDVLEIYRYHRLCRSMMDLTYSFRGIDVTPVILKSLELGMYCTATYGGLLIKCAFERMSRVHRIKKVLIWYEGRPFDLMAVSAIRQYFPDAECIAYELFPFDDLMLSMYFTKFQIESGNAPNRVLVPAGGFSSEFIKYTDAISVQEAPILRTQYELTKNNRTGERIRVLIVLPLYMDKCIEILNLMGSFMSMTDEPDRYSVIIKNHPALVNYRIEDYCLGGVDYEVEYVQGNLNECLRNADITVTSGSSSTLEIIYHCVPLIIVCGSGLLVNTRLPNGSLVDGRYRVVYDLDDFMEAMVDLESADYPPFDDFLLPVNCDTIQSMLGK